MEEDMKCNKLLCDVMEDLPKLVPFWHDVSHQQIIRNSNYSRFIKQKLPDFGGSGINIVLEGNEFKCKVAKHFDGKFDYASPTCSLPFLPVNKVSELGDPCLLPIKEANENLIKFSRSLEMSRRSFKIKSNDKYKKQILSSYKSLRKMVQKKDYKKIYLPDSVSRLAENFPKSTIIPPINMSYAGGCLSTSLSNNGSHIILHPTRNKLNRLSLTPIEVVNEPNKFFKPTFIEENFVKLKSGRILQIESLIDGYCYVRQKKFCHFVNFCDSENISLSNIVYKQDLMSVAASPYNPTDCILIYSKGNLELTDIEERKPKFQLYKSDYSCSYAQIDTIQGSLGPHPQSILCLTEKYLCSFDIRFEDYSKKTLFSSDYQSCFLDEKLISFKSSDQYNFHYMVTSSHHMFICDERYPGKPVLIYNHMLNGHPLYCDKAILSTTSDTADIMAVIGTQDSNEVCAFHVRANETLVQPVSLCPPIHLSSIADFGETLRLQCIPVEDAMMRRLKYPLTGLSILPHDVGSGFTVFQINSLGDLFYQDFKENHLQEVDLTRKVDVGCILTPAEQIQSEISYFMSGMIEGEEEATEVPHSVELDVNLVKVFKAMKDIPEKCPVCSSSKSKKIKNHKKKKKVSCPSCGFDNVLSQNFNDAFQRMSLISKPMKPPSLQNFDITPLYECTDKLSKTMLEDWNFLNDENESQAGSKCEELNFSFATSTPQQKSDNSQKMNSTPELDSLNFSLESQDDKLQRFFSNISKISFEMPPAVNNSQEKINEFPPASQELMSGIAADSQELMSGIAADSQELMSGIAADSQELMSDIAADSQQQMNEIVAASQEEMFLAGETLRLSKSFKKRLGGIKSEKSGFL